MQDVSDTFRLFSTDLVAAGLGLLGLLLGGALAPRLAQAQTPTTTIQNGAGDTRLQLNYDGGLYVPGIYLNDGTENDSIPAEGAGTRMMWYPAKAAFRVGRVGRVKDGTQWDASKVGDHSAAFGVDTKASGFAAAAMGTETTASGAQATAMSSLTTASGTNATAMGFGTTASGDEATAMGFGTTASGDEATAMGSATTAATDQSLSIGSYNDANTSSDSTLFVAGNGSSGSRSDALVLDKSGNLTISGTLTENSDRRLKTQIEPLGDSILQKLGELRPVRFEFRNQKTHPSGTQVGLVAQDVRKEFPALVSEGSGGYLSLAYPKMTAVLLKGMQEQQDQLEKKQAQIDSLKEKVRQIQEVKSRLAALERQHSSALAGLAGSGTGLLLAFLLGGLLGAALLWRRRD